MIVLPLYADQLSNLFNDFNLPNEPVQPPAVDLTTRYNKKTNPEHWSQVMNNKDACRIEPIAYADNNKDFDVNFTFNKIKRSSILTMLFAS